MELLKVEHPTMGFQLINSKDFDPNVHTLYQEPDSNSPDKNEQKGAEEIPPETTKAPPKRNPKQKGAE